MGFSRFAILFLLVSVYAISSAIACIDVITSKTEYLPYESVQAEVNSNLSRDIFLNDIFVLRQGNVLPTKVFISKISENKYVLWFDLPSTAGNYSLRVRGYCKNGNLYVKSVPFNVKTATSSYYEEIRKSISDWNSLSAEEHILASKVLSYDEVSKDNSVSAFFSREDSCLNKNCSTRLNALTLISFENDIIRQKMLDKIEASQNYVNGNWNIQINSESEQKCNLTINGNISIINLSQGINNYNLDFNTYKNDSTINVRLGCDNETSGKIIYTYKNIIKNFELDNSQISIDNSGCFGNGVKNECSAEATSYAILALYKTKSNFTDAELKAVSWLATNAETTEEKAFLYYVNKDYDILSEILNLQNANGWWPKAQNNYIQDVKATSVEVFALKNAINKSQTIKNSIERAEKWLLNQRLSLSDKLFVFSFGFQANEIEPQLSIWPGVVKTEGRFNLLMQNKGSIDINAEILLLNSSYDVKVPINSTKNIEFNIVSSTIDGRTLFENMIINYHSAISDINYNYVVPVIIFTQKSGLEQLNGTINLGEGTINESQLTNKTADINQDIIRLFRFAEQSVSKNISINEEYVIKVRLSNQLENEIKDISITYSSSLIGIITRIEPAYINNLVSEDIKIVNIYVKPTNTLIYDGDIIATGEYNSRKISTNLDLIIKGIIGETLEAKNCSELDGNICKEDETCKGSIIIAPDTDTCCIQGKCEKNEKGKSVAAIIVIAVIIILLIVLAILKRKPKKEMKEFLKGASQEYEKKFQRPLNIGR